jgi:metallo-beta-lactamase superfamily protein
MEFLIENTTDPNRISFLVTGVYKFRVKVIPIPGHTSGATAYLRQGGGHRCLFTGDTIYLREGEWVAAVLDSSDRASYIESLELIKGLDFDVLVLWLATAGQPFHAVTDRGDTGAASMRFSSAYGAATITENAPVEGERERRGNTCDAVRGPKVLETCGGAGPTNSTPGAQVLRP